ncbi:3-hydroxybutyryl-CoA dehydratase [Drepanopeziza brunnea f. sp. 'multigermtubi' MB_m1]|uniref:3-hydroxybutyryl-CoA dehydratase n=1 Tax=Marssonina brunnea f. sp. multigermtubi (strain MB_m1) TaxID=1072389 RepID=K1XAK2_MARBU|nr:3-hydroxybutyryl-CoA dehydratase [Drepanopeziza brunnea f. sp. 'multigermtubi' MB_m1]EKD17713.1 3-hydroxybutyryl-CoA dehydratase [Drepanopeziza brunnea f. sp. 'multigermtubi' MB_m1]
MAACGAARLIPAWSRVLSYFEASAGNSRLLIRACVAIFFPPVSKDQRTHEDRICWPFVRVPVSGAGVPLTLRCQCIADHGTVGIIEGAAHSMDGQAVRDIVSCGNKVVGTPTIWMTSDGMILPMEFEFAVVPAANVVFVFIQYFLAVSLYLTLIESPYQKRYVHPYSVLRLALLKALFTETSDYDRIIQVGKDVHHLWFALRAWRGVDPEGYFGDLGSWVEKRMEELGIDSAGIDSAMSRLVMTDSNSFASTNLAKSGRLRREDCWQSSTKLAPAVLPSRAKRRPGRMIKLPATQQSR